MKKNLEQANTWLAQHKAQVQKRYQPSYHAYVPCGWCNDPNGLIWYKGEVHLFYQHNPYAPQWDTMHWGHMSSSDFIHWQNHPVALAPDQPYDDGNGCFSGTAMEVDGKLYLMYTGVANDRQQQCLAYSEDGIHFSKLAGNPVISSEQLPHGYRTEDFRDPKIFRKDGTFYCLAGTKNDVGGNILLYRSEDLHHWEFVGELFSQNDQTASNYFCLPNAVCECPDYAVIDGQEVLIFSPQEMTGDGIRFQNRQCSVYMLGHLDFATGHFYYESMEELDTGFDFYAPQTWHMPDGRTLLLGWKDGWERDYPTKTDGWVGSFTIPCELHVKNGKLYRIPAKEVLEQFHKTVSYEHVSVCGEKQLPGIEGDRLILKVTAHMGDASRFGIRLLQDGQHETVLICDMDDNLLTLDRSCSGIPIGGRERDMACRRCHACMKDGLLSWTIFLDVSSVEVFAADGEQVLTANVYPDVGAERKITFFSEDGTTEILQAVKYEIIEGAVEKKIDSPQTSPLRFFSLPRQK